MTKKSIVLTLAALTSLGGVSFAALPAMAATFSQPIGTCSQMDTAGGDSYISDNAGLIANELAAKGYKASGIENFGGCVRTWLTEPNGQKVMAFFDATTLERVGANG